MRVCGCIMRVRGVWGVFGHFSHFRNFRFPYMGSLWKKFCGLQNFLLQGLSEIWGGYDASRKVTWTFWLNLNFRKNMIFFSKKIFFFKKSTFFFENRTFYDLRFSYFGRFGGEKTQNSILCGKGIELKIFSKSENRFFGSQKNFFSEKKIFKNLKNFFFRFQFWRFNSC